MNAIQHPGEWLALLNRISAAINAALSLDEALETATSELGMALCVQQASTILLDQETGQGRLVAKYRGAPEVAPPGGTLPIEQNPWLERVIATRTPVTIVDIRQESLPQDLRALLEAWDIRSIAILPMVARDQVIGAIHLSAVGQERVFAPEEIGLAQAVANYAGLAAANFRLVQGVRAADQAKSEFIDFVAHELKQPMTAMQGYAKMLTMGIGGEMNDTQKQFVNVITANVDRMGKLVNDLLEISRLEAGRIRVTLMPVHLPAVITQVAGDMQSEIAARHHTLELTIPEDLPPVLADRERLIQILTNLLSNACRYTPEGGTISISVGGQEGTEIPEGHLLVCIKDTGIGMSPQDLTNLEEKFFRADHDLVRAHPGTGLGVSITRHLVALCRGEFMVESKPGVGSIFRFTLPVVDQGTL